jgi:hypothetical protein
MAMTYNPYSAYQPKTPQQLQLELNSMLQNQYAPIYNAFQQQNNVQSPISNQPCTSGVYDKVTNYQEVENYPTPTNGTAILLFNYEQGIFYSKKFVNGQSVIQPFTFMPLNNNSETNTANSTNNTAEEQPQSTEDKILSYLESLTQRVEKLETRKQRTTTKKVNGEVKSDEL